MPIKSNYKPISVTGHIAKVGAWWRHQMETFSALLAICAGDSPVTGEFPAQRPVTRSFDVLFDLRLNERLSKQSWGWWFETLSRPLWRHYNGAVITYPAAGPLRWKVFYYAWLKCVYLIWYLTRFSPWPIFFYCLSIIFPILLQMVVR